MTSIPVTLTRRTRITNRRLKNGVNTWALILILLCGKLEGECTVGFSGNPAPKLLLFIVDVSIVHWVGVGGLSFPSKFTSYPQRTGENQCP